MTTGPGGREGKQEESEREEETKRTNRTIEPIREKITECETPKQGLQFLTKSKTMRLSDAIRIHERLISDYKRLVDRRTE